MKLKDGSESLRMKADVAKRIRSEAERLNMSFLETLYFICMTYFSLQANQSSVQTKTIVIEAKTSQSRIKGDEDDDDEYVFNMMD